MKIVRSILGVVVGALVAVVLIGCIEMASGVFLYPPPPDGKTLFEWGEEMKKSTPAAKAWMRSVPLSAMIAVQVAWSVGALVGGAVSAWIAGYARLIHAWLVGVIVLALTISNFIQMRDLLDYVHPDWLIATGLLLPMPLAVLGGLIVKRLTAAPPPTPIQTGQP